MFKTKDGADILISIQNDREWRILAENVMGDAALAADPKFANLMDRVKHRAETDGKVAAAFATMDVATLSEKLEAADIAFARVNDVAGLIEHPHLRRISVETPSGPVSYPAPAPIRDQAARVWRACRRWASIPRRCGRSSAEPHPERRQLADRRRLIAHAKPRPAAQRRRRADREHERDREHADRASAARSRWRRP